MYKQKSFLNISFITEIISVILRKHEKDLYLKIIKHQWKKPEKSQMERHGQVHGMEDST